MSPDQPTGGAEPAPSNAANGRGAFDERVTPRDLKVQLAEQKLVIDWKDGHKSVFPLAFLRRVCPCATCRTERETQQGGPDGGSPDAGRSLTVLKADPTGLRVTSARLVGNYAIQFFWSDGHYTGIYDFRFLRSLDSEEGSPGAKNDASP